MSGDVTIPADAVREAIADIMCAHLGHEHLGHPECAGTRRADVIIRSLTAKPPTLREKVAAIISRSDAYASDLNHADDVLAIIADELERRPLPEKGGTNYTHGFYGGWETARNADVAWLRGESS